MIKKKNNDLKSKEYNFDYMKTNKDNIENILRDITILPIINELVIKSNKIIIHSYQFLKQYLIYLYDKAIEFPLIDKKYLCNIFIVLTKRKCNIGGYTDDTMTQQLKTLTQFYNDYYSKTITNNEILYYDKLSYILAYEAIDMVTNINNNIQEHFIKHLYKYVNIVFDVKNKESEISKNNTDKTIIKQLHKQLYDEINKVKKDLISFGDLKSDVKYHEWIKNEKNNLFKNITQFKNNSIFYHLKSNTQDFLYSMFYLNNKLEIINDIIINKNLEINDNNKHKEIKQIRLFNVLPLRNNIISKNICIDTCGLLSNFINKKRKNTLTNQDKTKIENILDNNNYKKNNNQYDIWNKYFKLDSRVFKKNKYAFNYMIKTDGISCNVVFIRLDNNNEPSKKTIKNKNCCYEINTDYIENVVITEKMKTKKIVAIDPNHSDLIYCGMYLNDNTEQQTKHKNKLKTFRYTQNQRRLETRTKKYNKIINQINNETKINNKTVKELETILSKYNSKTINFNKFTKYLIEKNNLNNILFEHYQQKIFRKFKLNRYINMQKSEEKMIKNFTKKFGNKEDILIVFGDYDKGNYNMKGKEPSICKKFRRIFKNAGFEIYLINEFKTSMICHCCNNVTEKFMVRLSHKPKLYKEKKKK